MSGVKSRDATANDYVVEGDSAFSLGERSGKTVASLRYLTARALSTMEDRGHGRPEAAATERPFPARRPGACHAIFITTASWPSERHLQHGGSARKIGFCIAAGEVSGFPGAFSQRLCLDLRAHYRWRQYVPHVPMDRTRGVCLQRLGRAVYLRQRVYRALAQRYRNFCEDPCRHGQ